MDVTHLRGMLFEEAVLFLLRRSGYRTVDTYAGDPTLRDHPAGIAVVGRGARHQIDAIADYIIGQPFANPQRLLVEAKCFTNRAAVGLDVTRNAVGVLKDVSEFWATVDGVPRDHRRYHYQKAIFSATHFSVDAEKYAFAHDIHLFPMAESSCFSGVLGAIFGITRETLKNPRWEQERPTLRDVRRVVRDRFSGKELGGSLAELFSGQFGEEWTRYAAEVRSLGGVVVALVARTFPLFLVPASERILARLQSDQFVKVRWKRREGWTLQSERDEVLFSFDLPPVLFSMYAEAGVLSREQAALMKGEMFSDLQALIYQDHNLRLIRFELEPNWLQRLQDHSRNAAAQRDAIG